MGEGVNGGRKSRTDRMRKRRGSRLERWEERVAEVIKDKTKKEGDGGGRKSTR